MKDSSILFDKLLIDDLYPYDIHNNIIQFYDDKLTTRIASSDIRIKTETLNSLIIKSLGKDSGWYPVVISSLCDYKYVSNYGQAYLNERLGLDSFLTITNPKFRSWNTNGTIETDWALNNQNLPYRPSYGILCWASRRQVPGLQDGKTLDNFAVGDRIWNLSSVNCSSVFIKLNNEQVYNEATSEIKNISDLGGEQTLFYSATGCYRTISKLGTELTHMPLEYNLWISDGDCFLYYDTSQGAPPPGWSDSSLNTSNYLGYVSGSLYNTYTNIYRILTLDLKKELRPKDLKLSRKYKNLAKMLSTCPFITPTDIYNLDDPSIRDMISYIDIREIPPAGEKQKPTLSLISVVTSIVQILQNKSSKNNLDTLWKSDNCILTKSQLCEKILKKYGANLIARNNTFVSFKTDELPIGNNGISIQQAAEVYASKGLVPTVTQKITYDSVVIEPKFTGSRSYLSINDKTAKLSFDDIEGIPLFDIAKPSFGSYIDNHFLSPALTHKGNVAGIYRNNGIIYNEETQGFRTDHVYYAELNINPDTLIASPLSAQANIINIELQVLFTNFINANLYSATPFFNPDEFIESQCQFAWRKISGPEGYFSRPDDTRSTSGDEDGILPFRGTTNNVLFKTFYTGYFVLECSVTCPIGAFRFTKSFYVVDGRQKINVNNSFVTNPNYGKYWESDIKQWLFPSTPDTVDLIELPIIINNGQISLFNNIILDHQNGICFPAQTTAMVMEQIGVLRNVYNDKVFNLSSNYIFKYRDKNSYNFQFQKKGYLLINYICSSGTYTKINKFILSKIRSKLPGSENGVSLYQPNLRTKRKTFVIPGGQLSESARNEDAVSTERTNKYPSSFILTDYRRENTNDFRVEGRRTISYPKISTDSAPDIKTYGGYARSVINDLGIRDDIEGLVKPYIAVDVNKPLAAAISPVLPTISGHKLNYVNDKDSSSYKICYQKIKEIYPQPITCTKGVLDPNLGWIGFDKPDYGGKANRSAVLKFNPGARDTFSFIGPMFREIDKSNINTKTNTITPTEYSSSIVLGISDHIQWDPICSCEPGSGLVQKNYQDNILHKDYVDIKYNTTYFSHSNHGYRILAGGEPKDIERHARNSSSITNDEFDTQQTENVFTYKFAVTGPYNSTNKVRIPRVNNFGIKDIEIKLNFLNYVNMQDVIIVLETEYDGEENKKRFNERSISPISTDSKYFINQQLKSNVVGKADVDYMIDTLNLSRFQRSALIGKQWGSRFESWGKLIGAYMNELTSPHMNIQRYLERLTQTNSLSRQKKLQLVLWNQELLQNNSSNISLTFSDHADINSVAYDHNIYNYIDSSAIPIAYFLNDYQQKQHIISNNEYILPTHCSLGYSDRESCFYTNIIKNNRLCVVNNSLSKFVSESLFKNPPPEFGPCEEGGPKEQGSNYDGKTKFTLKFIIMDEPDTMYPYGNTILDKYHSGLETSDVIKKSTQIFNSLCNWELILHTNNTRHRAPYTTHNLSSYGNGDVLSLLDYNNGLAYPGYSYIADLTEYKHLLPLMNYNAPYNIIQDSTTCLTGIDDPSGQGIMMRPPDFPDWAIVAILASIASYAGLSGGSVVGAVSALPLAINNSAYQAIYDWFSANAIVSNLQDQGRQIFLPLYHKYPFGSPEKILLNFRKPGQLWYTAEAFISKYHNTPILQNTNYRFVKINNKNNLIKFSVIDSFEELIDEKLIVKPNEVQAVDCASSGKIDKKYDGHILDLSANCTNEEYKYKYYIFRDEVTYQIHRQRPAPATKYEDFSAMKHASYYMAMNSVVHLPDLADTTKKNLPIFVFDNYANIKNKKLIKIKGRLLYDTLRIKDALVFPYIKDKKEVFKTIEIYNVSLVYVKNSYYTVILLKDSIPDNSSEQFYIDNNANILLVSRPGTTYYDKKNIKPSNKWGVHDHTYKHDYYTSIDTTVRPKGSYGDGSPFIKKQLLSNNQINNDINNISKCLNNRNNHRIKHDTIYIRDSSGTVVNLKYSGGYSGFSYSIEEIGNTKDVFLSPKKDLRTIIPLSIDYTLLQQLDLSIALSTEYNSEIFFIRIEDTLDIKGDSGSLELITDQTEIIPEKDLTKKQVDILSKRFDLITNERTNPILDKLVGNSIATSQVLNSNNIKYIKKHLDALQAGDPNKTLTHDKLDALLAEKSSIALLMRSKVTTNISVTISKATLDGTVSGELLDETIDVYIIKTSKEIKTISKKEVLTDSNGNMLVKYSYAPKIINPNEKILSKYEYKITTNTDTSLSIEYVKINTDHYWINLDPKQSCVIDFAMNPKILVKTTYACVPASRLAMRTASVSNNACPEFLTIGGKAPDRSDPNVEEEFLTTTVIDPDNPNGSLTGYVYKIKNSIIQQKQQIAMSSFAGILGWKTITKTRYFNINGDEIIGELSDINGDITIQSSEEYLIPLTNQDGIGQSQSDISADNIEVPGIDPCQGLRTHEGSPGGKGLIGFIGGEAKRVGGPTRIENIVNLDNQNNIEINFKNIPRGLRPCDSLATIYRYGPKDIYRPANSAVPKVPYEVDFINNNGAINNSLYEWIAMQVDPQSKKLEYTTLPDFFKHQNEMFFRGLYGSIDQIEHKTDVVKSQYPFEMIPYEYTNE